MKRTPQELINSIESLLGDEAKLSDAAITLREDIADSVAVDTSEDWKSKYEENDRSWREKYAARFRDGAAPQGDVAIVPDTDPDEHVTEVHDYEDLFKTEQGV